jgi:PIN domain nuclease of toxin-antitoxin system
MKLLLDTCTFLWLATDRPELSRLARDSFEDSDNEIYLSVASAWEITIKQTRKTLGLPDVAERFIPLARKRLSVQSLALDEEMVLQVGRLPNLHRDPFDRILICQSIVTGMAILTPDELIRQYPVRTIW